MKSVTMYRLWLAMAAVATALTFSDAARGALVNRWSFSENGGSGTALVDTIGGLNATIVEQGGNNGDVGQTHAGQVFLTGGGKGSTDYVKFADNTFSAHSGDVTIETWATTYSAQNWSRVFSLGSTNSDVLMMSWTRGTNQNQDQVRWFDAGVTGDRDNQIEDSMAPYAYGQQYHIALTIDDDGGAGGKTLVKWYKDGVQQGSFDTDNKLSDLSDIESVLGRSKWGDNTANASWNEFRVYDEALKQFQIANNTVQGPDVVDILGPAGLTAAPINRWSFGETGGAGTTLVDSIGGADGTIVDLGASDGNVGSGQVTLAGGAKGSSDYVDLPDDILAGLGDASIETWATQHTVQNWSRIFDFGENNGNYVFMSWSRGTNMNQDRAGMNVGGETSVDDTMAPYTLDQEAHIVMTIDEDEGGGQTLIQLYKDGELMGGRLTDHRLSDLNDINNWLGRSQWPDNTANASWNEFRIYDYALSGQEILGNYMAGPDAINMEAGVPEPSTLVLLGLGVLGLLGLDVQRRRRRA